jgi:hypothetical protein
LLLSDVVIRYLHWPRIEVCYHKSVHAVLFEKRVRLFDQYIKTRKSNESRLQSPERFIAFDCFGTVINHAKRVFEVASHPKGN